MQSYTWKDSKGRIVEIHTMSDKWLKNLKKFLIKSGNNKEALESVKKELKRRKS